MVCVVPFDFCSDDCALLFIIITIIYYLNDIATKIIGILPTSITSEVKVFHRQRFSDIRIIYGHARIPLSYDCDAKTIQGGGHNMLILIYGFILC